MINIITGKINSGKTTKLLSIYNQIEKGDGFYNKKIFIDEKYVGQEIVRISTGQACIFSFKKENLPQGWDECFSYGDYSFSKKGFDYTDNIAKTIIQNGISPIYIDEIGPLELKLQGHYNNFIKLLQLEKEMYVVIRESCVSAVIELFKIKDYKII